MQLPNVQTVRIVDPPGDVADRYDACAALLHDQGRMCADVAEALDCHCRLFNVQFQMAKRLERDIHDASSGGIFSAEAASQRERFAGDDTGDRIAYLLTVRVHKPRHYLSISADIGRGHILVGADERKNLRGVATSQALELGAGERLGGDSHSPFRTAIGKAGQGALPCHPHGKGRDLPKVHVRMVANATLGRAPG